MEGVKGRGRSFKKRQSRRQTAMHNLVRNRWDAVYWNIHYNFSPFSLFLSPNCVSRGETRLPSTLANPTTTGNLWFTISTEHHPRLRFGLRPDISSLEAFFLFLFFFFSRYYGSYAFSTNGRGGYRRGNFVSFQIFSAYYNVYVAWNFTLSAIGYIFYILIM